MHRELTHPITIHVNDTPIEVEDQALLIDVLLEQNIMIPHFCYHEALGADGNCRMCMVGIEGAKRPQIACDTFVHEGMRVTTQSDAILKVKREILELELINHPVDCPICDQAGECKLQDYYMNFGLYESRLDTPKNLKGKRINLGSNVMLDQERCVLCARCTRFTQKITKTHELAIIGRGDQARVTTAPGQTLNNPYAMNVIDLCPVGALTSKDFRFRQRVWFLDSVPSLCHGCAKGCNIWIDHNQPKYAKDKVYRYRPRVNKAVNGHFLCDAGRLSYHAQNQAHDHGVLALDVPLDPEEAIHRFRQCILKHDVVALVHASLSLEHLALIKTYCSDHDIPLFALPHVDADFGDGWLRQADRHANTAGVRLLEIDQDPAAFKAALAQTDVLLNFNHPLTADDPLITSVQHLCFTTHSREAEPSADLQFSFAPYGMDEGSLINSDFRLQRFRRSLHQTSQTPTLREWLHRIDTTLPSNNLDIWRTLLHPVDGLQSIQYDQIPDDGIPLQGDNHA